MVASTTEAIKSEETRASIKDIYHLTDYKTIRSDQEFDDVFSELLRRWLGENAMDHARDETIFYICDTLDEWITSEEVYKKFDYHAKELLDDYFPLLKDLERFYEGYMHKNNLLSALSFFVHTTFPQKQYETDSERKVRLKNLNSKQEELKKSLLEVENFFHEYHVNYLEYRNNIINIAASNYYEDRGLPQRLPKSLKLLLQLPK